MTQTTRQEPQPVHPFDMEKSDFEKLLERDFKPMERVIDDVMAAQNDAHFARAVGMARAVDRLSNMLNEDAMSLLMPLMNTRLGFRCDKPNWKNTQPYTPAEVKACMIEALIRGAFLTGNEFNIIAGNCYFTKEYFWRKINEHPDVVEFSPVPGLPRYIGSVGGEAEDKLGAVVPYKVTYRMKGENTSRVLEREIPIRVNKTMGADAIIGKADRKMWATVWNAISGWREPLPDGDVDGTEPAKGEAANQRLLDANAAKQSKIPSDIPPAPLPANPSPSPNPGAAAPSNASGSSPSTEATDAKEPRQSASSLLEIPKGGSGSVKAPAGRTLPGEPPASLEAPAARGGRPGPKIESCPLCKPPFPLAGGKCPQCGWSKEEANGAKAPIPEKVPNESDASSPDPVELTKEDAATKAAAVPLTELRRKLSALSIGSSRQKEAWVKAKEECQFSGIVSEADDETVKQLAYWASFFQA